MLNKLLKKPIEAVLDLPLQNANLPGIITVAGWAFSRFGTIERIEIWLGGRFLGMANYGLARPDVAAPHGQAFLNCGYAATFSFDPADFIAGITTLILSITDSHSKRSLIKRLVNIISLDPAFASPQAEIEAASYYNGVLEVKGWAVWPTDEPPRTVSIYSYDRLLGSTPVNLDRPDIQARFPANPSAYRCGFHFMRPLPPEKLPSVISFEFDDARQRPLRLNTQVVNISPQWDNNSSLNSSLKTQLENLIDQCQLITNTTPTILDWYNTPSAAMLGSGSVVLSPIQPSISFLPYISQSIEIVLLSDANQTRLQEARRVATFAVAVVKEKGLELEWLTDKAFVSKTPTVSIIIPVYNKLEYTRDCLTQLFATLPDDFGGEIIVINDASNDATPQVLDVWAAAEPRLKILHNPENLGFINSCNRGAEAANGEYLIFLNNDTLPQPGWLSPLLQTFKDFPDAGVVGGKLTYPNNALQEAGNVIFSDGSGCNFGKHANPDYPLFNFVRQVDYCSGALLATSRSLFKELGGFDTRYRPAYYEDTDYCFAVRAKGYKVYYQPASQIIHFEGVSSGTDLAQGVKSYQLANRAKFVEKWQAVLQQQPAPSYVYDYAMWHRLAFYQRGSDLPLKKALICAARLPEFDRESGLQRIYDFIQFLREEGWAVSFLAHNANDGERYANLLQQQGVAIYAGAGSQLVSSDYRVDTDTLIANGNFDVAILVAWDVAELYLPTIRALSPSTRIVIDSLDLHFLREARRQLANPSSSLNTEFGDETRRELNIYAAADLVLTVSDKEAALLNDLTANPQLAQTVADAENLAPSPVPFDERKGMLFVGNFRHPPNRAALAFLLDEIVPLLDPTLLDEHPLYIVGNGLAELLVEGGSPLPPHAKGLGEISEGSNLIQGGSPHPQYKNGVKLVGWVPSLLPYLQRVRISLLPLTYGAGTKRKLIQSLMVGTPAVSTSVGIEGLNLQDGEQVLVADDPPNFASAINRLLHDPALWQKLTSNGQQQIATTHSRAVAKQQFLKGLRH